ncbi:hypothetical protein BIFGAL_02916 [Bifidobacterium gallicum DSM 20093 = LMG 11596]|nr:hypothetical protein BIFGAL_02916 [Bifidobacterium gallicum DSM 20093 = LMG 11596]
MDMTGQTHHAFPAPWSHRIGIWGGMLITVASAIATGIIGTLTHRIGATQNLPIGLVLGFVLVGMSAWCARSRGGITGLAVHLIFSSAIVGFMAVYGPGGDVLIPMAISGATLPFLSRNCGMIWFFGVVVMQIVMALLPARWFFIPNGDAGADDGNEARAAHFSHVTKTSGQGFAAYHVPHRPRRQ